MPDTEHHEHNYSEVDHSNATAIWVVLGIIVLAVLLWLLFASRMNTTSPPVTNSSQSTTNLSVPAVAPTTPTLSTSSAPAPTPTNSISTSTSTSY